MTLESIKYKRGNLQILDQLLLPFKTEYLSVKNTEDAWHVIRKMQVRGAPAIAMVGCLGLACELLKTDFSSTMELSKFIASQLDYLVTSRPTAVNMSKSAKHFTQQAAELQRKENMSVEDMKKCIIEEIERMLQKDINDNKSIGKFGAEDILKKSQSSRVRVLTHCNTGSLATAGYGTALGVIRALHDGGNLEHAYCTETRPYNQGARLTAYELVFENIPASLICDSMASMLMKRQKISAVVVGADRVVSNGDTANKIGTYQLAIIAKYHNVPFYVACPITSYDPSLKTGEDIVIEERPHKEMTSIKDVPVAAPGINCWNPAFDVTPAELITGGIITEYGIFKASEFGEQLKDLV